MKERQARANVDRRIRRGSMTGKPIAEQNKEEPSEAER
jgi:hypothetical protein